MNEPRQTYKRIRKLCNRYGFAEHEVRAARTRWVQAVGLSEFTERDFEEVCSNARGAGHTLTQEVDERLQPEALEAYRQLEDGRRAAYAAEHWPSTDHEPTVPNNEIPEGCVVTSECSENPEDKARVESYLGSDEPRPWHFGVDVGEDGGSRVTTFKREPDGSFVAVDVQIPPLRSGSIWEGGNEVVSREGFRATLGPSEATEDNGESMLFLTADNDSGACLAAWTQDVIALLERAGLVTRTVKSSAPEARLGVALDEMASTGDRPDGSAASDGSYRVPQADEPIAVGTPGAIISWQEAQRLNGLNVSLDWKCEGAHDWSRIPIGASLAEYTRMQYRIPLRAMTDSRDVAVAALSE